MDEYAGRVLAERYRLPLPPPGSAGLVDLVETRAFDTYSGQEVRVRQVPLPEIVDAEVLGEAPVSADPYDAAAGATRRPAEPVVRRAIEAAQAAAQIPDHPLLDQVFDVFAEAGSLWIVSEHVAARPLSALLAEGPLNPFRAAEIAADVLTALRALHAHGWVHRNITARTVLVCDDGRVLLTGLAAGAAEEALCGYAPVPDPDDPAFRAPVEEYAEEYADTDPVRYGDEAYDPPAEETYEPQTYEPEVYEPEVYGAEVYGAEVYEEQAHGPEAYAPQAYRPEAHGTETYETEGYGPEAYKPDAYETHVHETHVHETHVHETHVHETHVHETHVHETDVYETGEYVAPADAVAELPPAAEPVPYGADPYGLATPAPRPASPPEAPAVPPSADLRAARAGAIAAYRAATRAAAARIGDTGPLPVQRTPEPEPEPRSGQETAPELPSGPAPVPAPALDPEQESRPGAAPAVAEATRPGPAPQWWARAADDEDDDEDDEGDGEEDGRPYGGPRPPRLMLKGSWTDGPHASRDGSPPVPAGGGSVLPGSGRPALPAGYTAATPEPAHRNPRPPAGATVPAQPGPAGERYRGPSTRLAAERARQTRIAVVGAVTERWAPEQAGPVHENWRLAPPIGPATDLWALGALLYRAVQGHAPYPEDNAAELVQLVCAEPPAFAEECGPLRPVVESLLRQDPTERPDFEELRGWLRSLVRSAPEPEVDLAAAPPPPFDARRLPILRRRGELVRRRRAAAGSGRHRHRRGKDPRGGRTPASTPASVPEPHSASEEPVGFQESFESPESFGRQESFAPREPFESQASFESGPYEPRQGYEYGYEDVEPEPPRPPAAPRSLGRRLLLVGLLVLGAALAYAAVALPRGGEKPAEARPTATTAPPATSAPPKAPPTTTPTPTPTSPRSSAPSTPASAPPSAPGPALASGYVLREDPEGFRIGVPRDWRRSPVNAAGQVRYTGGDFTMIVVPGRDSVRDNGSDPLEYQSTKERELEPYRQSSWAELVKSRRVDIGRTPTAEGHYTWYDGAGRKVFVRNLALIDGGRYHVVQVIGPDSDRDKVSEVYEEAVKGFRPGR
ncbi:protein kinase [Streptomyces sp. NPDC056503]|uniref:protein kinase n=1 Tax=Streptomyces sp. NPDC056503 TaxID=3345842 RepID=UPI0036B45397